MFSAGFLKSADRKKSQDSLLIEKAPLLGAATGGTAGYLAAKISNKPLKEVTKNLDRLPAAASSESIYEALRPLAAPAKGGGVPKFQVHPEASAIAKQVMDYNRYESALGLRPESLRNKFLKAVTRISNINIAKKTQMGLIGGATIGFAVKALGGEKK